MPHQGSRERGHSKRREEVMFEGFNLKIFMVAGFAVALIVYLVMYY